MTSVTGIFSTAYFPPREWFHLFADVDLPVILNGKWKKQTLRNRCFILSPNGVQRLIVPVKTTEGLPVNDKDIRIDFSMPWIRLHLGAFEAAYNTSPFYEYLKDDIRMILESKPRFLFDLNNAIIALLLKKLKTDKKLIMLDEITDSVYNDYRLLSDVKTPVNQVRPDLENLTYLQVFGYKHPFTPALSALDMLCNCGKLA